MTRTFSAKEQVMYQMKGLISDLPEQQQSKIEEIRQQLKKLVDDNGECGFLAIALLSCEIAVEQES